MSVKTGQVHTAPRYRVMSQDIRDTGPALDHPSVACVRCEGGRDASTPPVGAGEPVAGCHPGRKLGTILHLELPQDARDMALDRLARQE